MKFLRPTILKNICERLLLNFIWKETPAQIFSCEFCELFESKFFAEHLRTAGSGIPVRVSLFNKVGSLTAWSPLTVLERDSSTGISLWILWNFSESIFAEHLLATTSHMMLFFFLFADQWGLQPKINLFGGAMVN